MEAFSFYTFLEMLKIVKRICTYNNVIIFVSVYNWLVKVVTLPV